MRLQQLQREETRDTSGVSFAEHRAKRQVCGDNRTRGEGIHFCVLVDAHGNLGLSICRVPVRWHGRFALVSRNQICWMWRPAGTLENEWTLSLNTLARQHEWRRENGRWKEGYVYG